MRPAALAVALLVACGGVSAACGGGGEAVEGERSSSILLHQGALYVASPDEEAVVRLDPDTLEELGRIEVSGRPARLAREGSRLLVSPARGSALSVLDTAAGTRVEVDLPCGGAGDVVLRGERAFVACPFDGRLLEVDLDAGEVVRTVALGGAPTALAWQGEVLTVADSARGGLHTLALAELDALPEAGWEAQHLATELAVLSDERAAIGLRALAPVAEAGEVAALYQRVDHDDRDRPPELGSYGEVVDEDPRIEPRLTGPCGQSYARFDGGGRVFSGPTALASGGGLLWIAHRGTRNVAVLDCAEGELLAHFAVGAGPLGLVLSDGGRTAHVDLAYDHAVALLRLPEGGATEILSPEQTVRRTAEPVGWSAEALDGRRVFHDATDTHLTPSGVVSCGTCHPDGGADHLAWFFHTEEIPRKVRRTPPAWGADPSSKPLHWDGEFTEAAALVTATTTGLMGGDGLLVDTEAVAAFMAEAEPPPPRPLTDEEAEAAELGGATFESAGCGDCHLEGGLASDGLLHAVLPELGDADEDLAEAVTPRLLALRARAPYLHDGRAETLHDVLSTHNPDDLHGRTADLDDAELDALVAYLESL